MTVPTGRALLLFASLSPLAFLGYATPLALDLLVLANLVLVLLVLIDSRLATRPAALRLERFGPDSFSVGRSTEYGYFWVNPGRRPAQLVVRETRPGLLGGVSPQRSLRVPARGTVREALAITPLRRGRETAGWLAIRSRGPLGLAFRQGRVELPWTATVYPPLPASRLRASVAEAVRRKESGLRSLRQLGEGRQFESLREWVPGDDTRHIDWKATARRHKLITRQYEEERRQQVMLVIDAGRLVTADLGGRSRIEHVVEAALWLALAANYHDDDVGVMVFSNEIHHYVAPRRGRRGLREVLEILAVVEPKMVEPDYPAAFRYLAVRNRKRALTVFFTDVIDRIASEALVSNVASLSPRHLPLVITLRNPALDRVATLRPAMMSEAYRKAAAEELIRVRNEALSGMRRSGAIVLDSHPANAGSVAVGRYLDLKRRGML